MWNFKFGIKSLADWNSRHSEKGFKTVGKYEDIGKLAELNYMRSEKQELCFFDQTVL